MPLYAYVESAIAKKSDGLIFINKSVKKEIEILTHNKHCINTCIIYNGVDTSRFKPYEIDHKLRHKYGLFEDDEEGRGGRGTEGRGGSTRKDISRSK